MNWTEIKQIYKSNMNIFQGHNHGNLHGSFRFATSLNQQMTLLQNHITFLTCDQFWFHMQPFGLSAETLTVKDDDFVEWPPAELCWPTSQHGRSGHEEVSAWSSPQVLRKHRSSAEIFSKFVAFSLDFKLILIYSAVIFI